MKMNEIAFEVSKQEDGYYIATTKNTLKKGGFVTEAPDYDTLKEKIREGMEFFLEDGYHKELGLSENPQIRLLYSELLFENPEAKERIIIEGKPIDRGYRATSNTYVNIDLTHLNLEELKKLVSQEIRNQKQQDKEVEFKLEEIL